MGSNPSKIQRPDSINATITGSDEYKTTVKPKQYEFVCTTCSRDNKHVNASSLCKICQDYLCFKCLLWHSKYRSDHVDEMVGLDEMRKLGIQGPTVMPAEKCVAHGGEIWNLLCPKDGVAGCKQCMDQDHTSCGKAIPRSSRQIEAVNRQMKKASLPKNDIEHGIKSPRNDSQPRHYSDGEVDGKSAEKSERSNDGQVPGRKHKPLFDTADLQVSGKLKNVRQNLITDPADGSKQIHITPTVTDGQVPGIRSKYHEMYSIKRSREVNVRLQGDSKTCKIHDLCLLSEGRIIMSDFYNKNLKLFDSDLNISNYFDLSKNPTSICMINDTEVAVGRSIQFVAITSRIEMMRSIKLDHVCDGLVYSAGEL